MANVARRVPKYLALEWHDTYQHAADRVRELEEIGYRYLDIVPRRNADGEMGEMIIDRDYAARAKSVEVAP